MTSNSKIDSHQLHALTDREGVLHHVAQQIPGNPLMEGEFMINQQVSGIWVHASRVKELQNATSTFELPSGLSCTFMLEGKAKFLLGKTETCFEAKPEKIECSTICLARNEIMTRRIEKGASVYKLNISIDKANLESRCKHQGDKLDIQGLFQNHGAIYQWPVSKTLNKLIEKLMLLINEQRLLDRLKIESYATEIFSHVLPKLIEQSQAELAFNKPKLSIDTYQYKRKSPNVRSLKDKIDKLMHKTTDLSEIAQHLNMSVSTLQRKFKASYHFTVIEYIRRQKLYIARNMMVKEGINIKEAASIAGYKHTANFVTAFRKAFGITPHAFYKGIYH